jgi:hypothetical protein
MCIDSSSSNGQKELAASFSVPDLNANRRAKITVAEEGSSVGDDRGTAPRRRLLPDINAARNAAAAVEVAESLRRHRPAVAETAGQQPAALVQQQASAQLLLPPMPSTASSSTASTGGPSKPLWQRSAVSLQLASQPQGRPVGIASRVAEEMATLPPTPDAGSASSSSAEQFSSLGGGRSRKSSNNGKKKKKTGAFIASPIVGTAAWKRKWLMNDNDYMNDQIKELRKGAIRFQHLLGTIDETELFENNTLFNQSSVNLSRRKDDKWSAQQRSKSLERAKSLASIDSSAGNGRSERKGAPAPLEACTSEMVKLTQQIASSHNSMGWSPSKLEEAELA